MFDRATILRTAHSAARARMAPSASFRYGDRFNAEAGGYVPTYGYREAFRIALLTAWHDAKYQAQAEAWEAAEPALPPAIADRVAELRDEAEFEPITMRGNERFSAIYAAARDLKEAALAALQ